MPGREHELNEKQTRAKYTLEFKQEAVRPVKSGRAASAVAATLGMPKASLTNWVRADARGQVAAVLQLGLSGHADSLGHTQLDVTQGQLLGQRSQGALVGAVEDGLRSWPAVCHTWAGTPGDHGLDRLLQPLAATFGAGLPQPDVVRTTLVGGAA